jgi:hypothetical protein
MSVGLYKVKKQDRCLYTAVISRVNTATYFGYTYVAIISLDIQP